MFQRYIINVTVTYKFTAYKKKLFELLVIIYNKLHFTSKIISEFYILIKLNYLLILDFQILFLSKTIKTELYLCLRFL